jgi:hypothetical protein
VYSTAGTNAKFMFGILDSDLSLHKYSDNDHKEEVLQQVAIELNQPAKSFVLSSIVFIYKQ